MSQATNHFRSTCWRIALLQSERAGYTRLTRIPARGYSSINYLFFLSAPPGGWRLNAHNAFGFSLWFLTEFERFFIIRLFVFPFETSTRQGGFFYQCNFMIALQIGSVSLYPSELGGWARSFVFPPPISTRFWRFFLLIDFSVVFHHFG